MVLKRKRGPEGPPGFLSLVVPDCAQGPVTLDRCHLAELTPDGRWRSLPPTSRIELET